MLMKPASEERRKGFFGTINYRTRQAYEASYTAMLNKYTAILKRCVNRKVRFLSFVSVGLCFVGIIFFASHLSSGLVPQEDQGTCMMVVNGVPGNNLATTDAILDKVENIIKDTKEVKDYQRVAGYSFMAGQGVAYGMYIIKLKPWQERRYGFWSLIDNFKSTSTIVSGLLTKRLLEEIPEAQCLVFEPGMIPGYGMGSIELNLQDTRGGDKAQFLDYTNQFLAALNNHPEISRAITSYSRTFPQYKVELDAAQCKRAGVSPSSVLEVLGSYCGGAYVSNMNQYGKVYRVMLQANEQSRLETADLNNMFVRNGSEMAPISQFVKLSKILGPEVDTRFNLFSSISCNIVPAAGYSNTDAMSVVEEE